MAIQSKAVLADNFPVMSGPLFFDEKIMTTAYQDGSMEKDQLFFFY